MPDVRIDFFAQPPGWPIELELWELFRLRRDPDYIPPKTAEERALRAAEADARSALLRARYRVVNAVGSGRARRGAETRRRRAREEAESRAGLARVEGSGERSLREIQEQLAELTASDDDEDLQSRAPERRGPSARRDQGE